MAKRDYYKVLDVPRTATEAEIKKAYRRLAMKYHPDRNPDDRDAEESFKEAKEACEVLTDPHKRAAYDQHGHAGVEASGRAGGARGGFSADAFGDIFGDVFGDIFGGARRSGRSQAFRGADLRYELELELPQAVFGHHAEIEVARLAECEVCKGSGAATAGQPANSDPCGGGGWGARRSGRASGGGAAEDSARDPGGARVSSPGQGSEARAWGRARGPFLPGGRRDARAPHRGAARADPAARRIADEAGR